MELAGLPGRNFSSDILDTECYFGTMRMKMVIMV
jgi:hypothetical protein